MRRQLINFNADIVRKIATDYPECANGLLRTCKDYNRWITDDTHTFTKIKQHFTVNLYDKLQDLLLKFFSPDLRHIYTNTTNNHHLIVVPAYSPTYHSYLEKLKVSTKGPMNGGLYIGGGGKELYIKCIWSINQTECIDYLSFNDFYSLFENSYQRDILKQLGKYKTKFMNVITVQENIDHSADEMLGILSNLDHILTKGRDHWYKKNEGISDIYQLSYAKKSEYWPHGFAKLSIAMFVSVLILGAITRNMRKVSLLGLYGLFFMCVYTLIGYII